MTKDDVLEVFLDLQDELPTDMTIQLGRLDQLGALPPIPAANDLGGDVVLSFKAGSDQVQLDAVLNELRNGLGRFLSMYDQYSGEVSCIIRLRKR